MAKKINLTSSGTSSKYNKYLYKSNKKIIITAAVAVTAVLAVVGVVGVQMYNKSKIDSAKTSVLKFEEGIRIVPMDVIPTQDSDGDGIVNGDEISMGTDYLLADTDGDGLSDGVEKNLKSDPFNPDSDGDGFVDGVEVAAGLDPTSPTTKGVDDKSMKFTLSRSCEELTAEITGDASVYGAIVEKVALTGFSANSSIISNAYEIYNADGFDSCKLSFLIDKNKISGDCSVFRFNVSDGSFEKITSEVSESTGVVSAQITKNGTYMIADNKTIDSETKTRVHFLIDNSGSMYPDDMIPNSPENDVYFKRLDFAKQLIEKFDDTYTFAVSRFTKDYHYMQEFTDDKKRLKDILDNIKTLDENFNGTYIQYSLEECLKSFTETDEKTVNIIILVTDGDTTEDKSPDTDYIAKLAEEKNVIILTVSIGNNIDKSILNDIAQKTNGKYYSASDADLLDQVHSQIVATLDYDKTNITSSDSGAGYGFMLYNTGFVPSENGFGFEDYRTMSNDTVSFGMCLFAKKWFVGDIQLKMSDIKNDKIEADGYNFESTDFETYLENHKKLRGISLVGVTTSRFIDSSKYLDFSNKNTTALSALEDIKKESEQKGWSYKRYQFDNAVLDWTSVNLLALDVENKSDKIADAYGDSEAEFYKAVNRLNVDFYNQAAFINLSSGDSGFESLCEKLKNGEPTVVVIDGNYSLLATSMIKNADNPSEYIIRVYDPSQKDMVNELVIHKTVGCELNLDGTVKNVKNYYRAEYKSENVSLLVYQN